MFECELQVYKLIGHLCTYQGSLTIGSIGFTFWIKGLSNSILWELGDGPDGYGLPRGFHDKQGLENAISFGILD